LSLKFAYSIIVVFGYPTSFTVALAKVNCVRRSFSEGGSLTAEVLTKAIIVHRSPAYWHAVLAKVNITRRSPGEGGFRYIVPKAY
jgi:hypothetical protein